MVALSWIEPASSARTAWYLLDISHPGEEIEKSGIRGERHIPLFVCPHQRPMKRTSR